MDPETRAVVADIRAYATQRGLAEVAAFAGSLLAGEAPTPVLLGVAAGIDATPFRRWLAGILHGQPIAEQVLDGLAAQLAPAVRADRLIALFECGRLIEPEAAEAVVRACFSRPAGSYAVVLTAAEQIETEKDLDLVERSAWRLLVPEPERESNPQRGHLGQHAVFLWSAADPGAVPATVRARVTADQARLAAWLAPAGEADRGPVPRAADGEGSALAADLARYRVFYTLVLAEDALRAATPGPRAAGDNPDATRIYNLGREVGALKTRVLGRLEATAATIEHALLASLESLRLEMGEGLRPAFSAARLAESGGALSEKRLARFMEDYIARHLGRWTAEANRSLAGYETEAIASTRELLDLVDWTQVDAIAAASGQPAAASRARLEALIQPSPTRAGAVAQPPRPVDQVAAAARGRPGALQDPLDGSTVARAAVGGAIVGLGTALLGFGPIGLVIGVGVGAGMASMERKNRLDRNLDYGLQYGHAAVDGVIDRAVGRVRELRGKMDELREQLAGELAALESTLERAAGQPAPLDPAVAALASDHARLEDFRIRLAPA